jgi:ribonuclease BN (tRNA processing enzyme)
MVDAWEGAVRQVARHAPTLAVLGCDGSYPGPGGAASGYLVSWAGTSVWMDAGPGTFANLQLLMDPGEIDAVVLSHEHPDHWSDVESFAVWLLLHPETGPVTVYAPPGLRDHSYLGERSPLRWREVEPDERVDIGSLGCTFRRTDHGPVTLAVRLDATAPASGMGQDEPTVLGYTADTGDGWSPESLGPGLGTLLCEASYTQDREGSFQHLSGRQAGTMAAAAGAGTLILTHRWPDVVAEALAFEADEAFGRAVHQAAIGKVFEW